MVLESIIIPDEMERHPKRMFYVGFIYATVGLLLGYFIFGRYASLSSIFLTTMPLIVIMYRAFELEERKDIVLHGEFSLMKEHTYVLSFFLYLFVGMVVSYAICFSLLPAGVVENLFASQIETIESITSGNIDVTGASYQLGSLKTILLTNVRVWVFCILFSFLYGSGAIFILAWNASVIGVAAGNILRRIISSYAQADHYTRIYNYFAAFPMSFSYLIHGIPEVSAYFLGALGGGIISVAVIKHDFRSKNFRKVLIDSVDLLVLSIIVLLLAAFIEVYVTPMTI